MTAFREATKDIYPDYLLFCKTTDLTHVVLYGCWRIPIASLSFIDWCKWMREIGAFDVQPLPELQSSDLTFSEAFTDYEEVAA